MKYLLILLLFISIDTIGQQTPTWATRTTYLTLVKKDNYYFAELINNRCILTKNALGVTLVKKDTTNYDQSITDKQLFGIMATYQFIGSGYIYWANGTRNVSDVEVYFFIRKKLSR